MSNFERTTSWQQIQQGVKEAERLIVSRDYNLVMVKARQILECMVRCLAEKACLVDGDLADTIDQLYDTGSIKPRRMIIIPSVFWEIKRFMKMTIQRIMPTRHTSF